MDPDDLNILANLLHTYLRMAPLPYSYVTKYRCDLVEFQRWAEVETERKHTLEEINQAVQVLIDFQLITRPRNWQDLSKTS